MVPERSSQALGSPIPHLRLRFVRDDERRGRRAALAMTRRREPTFRLSSRFRRSRRPGTSNPKSRGSSRGGRRKAAGCRFRTTTRPGGFWIPAFAGMTAVEEATPSRLKPASLTPLFSSSRTPPPFCVLPDAGKAGDPGSESRGPVGGARPSPRTLVPLRFRLALRFAGMTKREAGAKSPASCGPPPYNRTGWPLWAESVAASASRCAISPSWPLGEGRVVPRAQSMKAASCSR